MRRPLGVLAVLVVLCAFLEHALAARAERAARARQRVGTLFTLAEARELRKLPALTLELPGERARYGRVGGAWRCLSLHDAPCDDRAVQELIDACVQAEGLVQTRSVEEAPRYGLNVPTTVRIVLQGPAAGQAPGGDVRAVLELGAGNGSTSFARRQGTKEIWNLAGDLHALLARRVAPGLPPLLAPALVPAAWREASGGIVRVERSGPEGELVLERRERALDPQSLQPGALPWTWVLDPGPDERVDDGLERVVSALESLSYVEVLAPARRGEFALEPPLATLRLVPREGAPLVLRFGARTSDGGVVWVENGAHLYRLSPAALDAALAPRARLLAELEQAATTPEER